MTDKYEKIRQALKMGPSKGPWEAELQTEAAHSAYGVTDGWKINGPDYIPDWEDTFFSKADAYYITTCDPDTIRALLADYDRLREALDRAATSLNTIATLAGSKDGSLEDVFQVRGYAHSRARVARATLSQQEKS